MACLSKDKNLAIVTISSEISQKGHYRKSLVGALNRILAQLVYCAYMEIFFGEDLERHNNSATSSCLSPCWDRIIIYRANAI